MNYTLLSKNDAWLSYIKFAEDNPELFKQNDELDIIFDETVVEKYVKSNNVTIGICYMSKYSMVVVDLVRDKNGNIFHYERTLPKVKEGAVVTIPKYKEHYVLLKQFRHSLRDYQYAFPRGFAEPALPVEENLKKELNEEVGAKVISYSFLGKVVADSGLSGNKVSVFVCEITEPCLEKGYEGIDDIVFLDNCEMKKWISEGKINDGFTLSAMALYFTSFISE